MSGVQDIDRLRELLGGDDLAWLRHALRRRFERGGDATGTLSRRAATPAEREAADRLFGRRPTGGAEVRVVIAALEARLREARVCDTLRAALEALDGPIRDVRAENEARDRAWARVEGRLEHACAERPWLVPWWDAVRSKGLLRRLTRGDASDADRLVDAFLALLVELPARGASLPELAARITGDAHALDHGAPLGTLAARAVAVMGGVEEYRRPDEWREAWARAGVLCDEVSAPVLTLNLGAVGPQREGLTSRVLALHREAGELCTLTLRQLVRHPPGLAHLEGEDVFVCENPTIAVAAARRLGLHAPPLVCTAGQPRASVRFLLRRLSEAGARLRVRADFDAAGLHIATGLLQVEGAVPWRMGAADYRSATGAPLSPARLPDTPWEPALREAMIRRALAVHEESLLDALIADMAG